MKYQNNAFCIVSPRCPHRMVSISAEFAALVHFSEHELLGRGFATLHGPETDSLAIYASIKGTNNEPQNTLDITLYGRDGDRHQCTASFAAELDSDGNTIGCEISVRSLHRDDAASAVAAPLASPAPPNRRCKGHPGPCAQHLAPGINRRRYNLYVGLLLEQEAGSNTQTAATCLMEEALLGQLIAMSA